MQLTRLLVIINAVLAATLGVRLWMQEPAHDHHAQPSETGVIWHASWVTQYPDLESATADAESVVTARVMEIIPVELQSQDQAPRGQRATLPGEVIVFQATDTDVKRGKRNGERFHVFHTGRSQGVEISIQGDPAYEVGGEYVLFLMPGPTVEVRGRATPTQVIVSPEGRWQVNRETRLVESPSDLEWTRSERRTARDIMDEARRADARWGRPERD